MLHSQLSLFPLFFRLLAKSNYSILFSKFKALFSFTELVTMMVRVMCFQVIDTCVKYIVDLIRNFVMLCLGERAFFAKCIFVNVAFCKVLFRKVLFVENKCVQIIFCELCYLVDVFLDKVYFSDSFYTTTLQIMS